MTPKERALAWLSGRQADRPAVINPTSVATAESCGSVGVKFNEVHLDAEKMSALAAIGYEKLGFDSVMPYFSVVHEAAALGCSIDWGGEDTMPNQRGALLSDPEQFTMPKDFLDRRPIRTILEAIKILKKKLGEKALIIGKVMGPWTLSYHLYGLEEFLVALASEPAAAAELLRRLKEITLVFAQAQFEAGADVITLADHATADLVSPLSYKEHLLPVHKEINKKFHGNKLILHCCGNTADRVSYFREAGFAAFHFDSKNDIDKIIELSGDMKLTGCINNSDILLNGTKRDVRKQTEFLIKKGIGLISPECAIPLRVKNENLTEIARTAEGSRMQPENSAS